jgi:plastocyanin
MVITNFNYKEYMSTTGNTNTSAFFHYDPHFIIKSKIIISIILLSSLVNLSLYTCNQLIFALKPPNELVPLNVTAAHPSNENATPSYLPPQQQLSSETAIQIVKIVSGASSKGNEAYQPNQIIVRPGMTIKWQNEDNILHTVTSGYGIGDQEKGNEFDSPLIQPDQMFFYKFSKSGVFPYFCVAHPVMIGEVIVENEKHGTMPQQQQEQGGEDKEKEEKKNNSK